MGRRVKTTDPMFLFRTATDKVADDNLLLLQPISSVACVCVPNPHQSLHTHCLLSNRGNIEDNILASCYYLIFISVEYKVSKLVVIKY